MKKKKGTKRTEEAISEEKKNANSKSKKEIHTTENVE